jgi:hypothetical protein
VDDGLDFVLQERLLQGLFIEQFAANKFGAGRDAFAMPFAQIVIDDCGVARGEQFLHHDAADVAGASGY